MSTQQLATREDIALLISLFYKKVRVDPLLGPIFNKAISDWPAHEVHLTNFWEGNLLFTKAFHGDPLKAHAEVDAQNDHSIEPLHFGVWLNLWFETIDTHFTGDIAQKAKRQARKMSTFLYLHIFEARKEKGV
ncbi:MAG: group III truncated hemoglobin [Gilvibacter sp.]